jgi:hypothetical protein
MKYLKLFENFTGKISENLQYHIDINLLLRIYLDQVLINTLI